MFSEVVRSYMKESCVTVNPGELSATATPEERARHKQRCKIFFTTSMATPIDKKQLERAASLEFLRGIDNSLNASFNLRLQEFVGAPAPSKGPQDSDTAKASVGHLPLAVFCLDECSIGWSALYYLIFDQGANVLGIRDPAHRANNDFKLIAKHAGLWQVVVSCVLVFNLAHGPWGSGRWWKTAQAAATSYSTNCQGCMLSQFLDSRIRKETGGQAVGPELLASAVSSKGPRVALTRWMSWLQAARIHLKHWWSRLLIFLVAGIELNYFNSAEQFAVFDLKTERVEIEAAPEDEEIVADGPTSVEQEQVLKMQRTNARNNIHTACLIMSNDETHRKATMLQCVLAALAEEHTVTSHSLRSGSKASRKLYSEWASGSWMQVIYSGLETSTDFQKLETCGFTTEFEFHWQTAADSVEGQCFNKSENLWAGRLMDLIRSLMFIRIRTMLWHTRSTPGLLAAYPSDSQAAISIMSVYKFKRWPSVGHLATACLIQVACI